MKKLTPILRPVKGHNSFKNIMEQGVKVKTSDAFGCFILSDKEKSIPITEFGIAISKRNAKKAVVRNRIKRLLRESLIKIVKESPELLLRIDKFIVIWKTAPSHPGMIKLKDIEPTVKLLFEKVNRDTQRLS